MKKYLLGILVGLFVLAGVSTPQPQTGAQEKAPPVVAKAAHPRGHKHPTRQVLRLMYELSNLKHRAFKAAVPNVTLASYDARTQTLNCVPPVGDQSSCGDCYAWSGCKVADACLITNGILPPGSMLAVSYFLDCQNVGGCDGGDEYQVAQIIQHTGAPTLAAYGGDGVNPGKCKSTTGMTLYKVDSIVMVGSQQGVAATQDIKNYIYQSGYVSVAAAAGSDWDNASATTTITGHSTGVNHAIGLVGWDDAHDNGDGSKGAWIMQNNWGLEWAMQGYAWIKYGADEIGTEAFVCMNASQPVRAFPPVTPVPPTPVPVPPGPTPVPVPGTVGTVTIANLPGGNGTYELLPVGTQSTVNQFVAQMTALFPPALPVTPPSPCDAKIKAMEARIAAQEELQDRALRVIERMEKRIGGDPKPLPKGP